MIENKAKIIKWSKELVKMLFGLVLYAVGIVFTINAQLGLAPWDIFNDGVSLQSGLSFGQASIIIGIVIVAIDFILKEKVGIGTLLNMVLIGVFIDIMLDHKLIPEFDHWLLQGAMLLAGMVIISFATFFYVSVGWGIGPRDGLMVALCKKTGKSVRVCRTSTEVIVAVLGYLLGGRLGIGTVIMATVFGSITQFVFKILHFDIKKVEHSYIDDEIRKYFVRNKDISLKEISQDISNFSESDSENVPESSFPAGDREFEGADGHCDNLTSVEQEAH